MDNLARTGAQVLATSCPACIIHLAYGVRKRRLPVRVCHISELISPRLRRPKTPFLSAVRRMFFVWGLFFLVV